MTFVAAARSYVAPPAASFEQIQVLLGHALVVALDMRIATAGENFSTGKLAKAARPP